MPRIRPFAPRDAPALDEVCVRTGDAGTDATGHFGGDDALLPDVYLRPYLARHPEFAFVVEADDGRTVGYVVATPDTEGFDAWFRDEWWPARVDRHDPDAGPAREASARAGNVWATRHPAHLHIDLVPEVQGHGWGRRLIETELTALRDARVAGVHLVASAQNSGALAFYRRIGFDELDADDDRVVFARTL